MKKKLFLLTMLASMSIGGNVFAFDGEPNPNQTNTNMTTKQTAAEKKEATAKRAEAKKEAAEKRTQAKTSVKDTTATGKKKHKKFLGIF
jgi:LAS superfamily LD-carboxypeptidase LdcB